MKIESREESRASLERQVYFGIQEDLSSSGFHPWVIGKPGLTMSMCRNHSDRNSRTRIQPWKWLHGLGGWTPSPCHRASHGPASMAL